LKQHQSMEANLALVSETDRLVVLLEEIAYAESQLQPQDTGHINTAISWMKHRVHTIKEKMDERN